MPLLSRNPKKSGDFRRNMNSFHHPRAVASGYLGSGGGCCGDGCGIKFIIQRSGICGGHGIMHRTSCCFPCKSHKRLLCTVVCAIIRSNCRRNGIRLNDGYRNRYCGERIIICVCRNGNVYGYCSNGIARSQNSVTVYCTAVRIAADFVFNRTRCGACGRNATDYTVSSASTPDHIIVHIPLFSVFMYFLSVQNLQIYRSIRCD